MLAGQGIGRAASPHFDPDAAPHKGEAVDQAPVLRMHIWLKNEQPFASHAGYGAAPAMNGLSTDCSTVFVRKRKARA
ncbi:hypothetical protein [Pseudomonas migulae]|uniref:Uncharacterized protein n=1 Tax=Pseudomonas migulae TaxID=78543 RepID=A0ABY8MW52_9PSED|nr:hypothetical protein [Pseudomonas migulae]WGK91243.1 hypothetical protein MOQ58_03345 [Pseudomonas migulae]